MSLLAIDDLIRPEEHPSACRRGHSLTNKTSYRDSRGWLVCRLCRALREKPKGRRCTAPGCTTILFRSEGERRYLCDVHRKDRDATKGPHRTCAACGARKPLQLFHIPGTGGQRTLGKRQFRDVCDACSPNDDDAYPDDSPWEKAIKDVCVVTGLAREQWFPDMHHPLHRLWFAFVVQHHDRLPGVQKIKGPGAAKLLALALKECDRFVVKHTLEEAA